MKLTQAFTFTLSQRPTSNNNLTGRSRRRVYRSADYAEWRAGALYELRAQNIGRVEGPYAIELRFSRKNRVHPDLGNMEKAMSDTLQAYGAIVNDKLAQRTTLGWARQDTAVWGQVISTKEVW